MIKKAIFALALLAATVCQAQFIGFVSQQSVTSTPFNAVPCTSALSTGLVIVPNIGQSAHFVTSFPAGGMITLVYTIQGSYDGVNYFDISDPGTNTVNSGAQTGVNGDGYYPVVGVRVSQCSPGTATITLKYSGISMTPGQPVGTNQQGQYVKNLAVQAPAGSGLASSTIRSPFGSSGGTLQFVYSGTAGPAGSFLQVGCGTNNSFIPIVFQQFPLVVTAGVVQFVPLPARSCNWFNVDYVQGGASTATYNLDIAFNSVASSADPCSDYPKNTVAITAAAGTTQILAPAAGGVLSIYVCGYQTSQSAAGTMQWEYGVAGGGCTGMTPFSGVMTTATGTPFTFSGPGTLMRIPPLSSLCLVTTTATTAGILDYALAVP
jgi:hypothetical protein